MPLASMSNVTSICGTPRGAGGICFQIELAKDLVVRSHLAFALEHADRHRVLVVLGGAEHLRLLVGIVVLRSISRVNTPPSVSIPSDSGVTSSSTTSLTSPCSTPAWMAAPSATTSSGFTPLWGFLAEEFGHFLDDLRHPRHAADQHHLVDVAHGQARIFQRVLARLDRLHDQVTHQRFQLRPGEFHHQVQRVTRVAVHADERLVDLGLLAGRQLDLAFSAASFRRSSAILSSVRSTPCSFLNSSAR